MGSVENLLHQWILEQQYLSFLDAAADAQGLLGWIFVVQMTHKYFSLPCIGARFER